jgi:hypothetical protein
MCETLTTDDVGKLVETGDGDVVGVVAAVDEPVARVSPVPATDDSNAAAPTMASGADETQPLEPPSVRAVTADRVVLEDDCSLELGPSASGEPERTTSSAGDLTDELDDADSRGRGAEADSGALTEQGPEAELDPDELDRRTDAKVSADDELRRTDAAVDRGDTDSDDR